MKKFVIAAVSMTAMAAAAMLAGRASAQTVSTSYTFTGIVRGDAVNPFDGSFSLLNTAGSYTLTAFSGSYRTATFNLVNTGLIQASPSFLQIGGRVSGVAGQQGYTDDFYLTFNPATVSTAGGRPTVSTTTTQATDVDFTFFAVPATVAAVPEPATWGMAIIGFGLIGANIRRRKLTTRFLYAG